EQMNRDSEEICRFLTENSTDMIFRHRPDSTILYVTHSCEGTLGYRPEEMLGRPASDFVVPEDMEGIWEANRKAQQSGEDLYRAEFRMVRKDGSVVWAETLSRLIRDRQGEVVEVHSSVRDITERRQVEEALRRSEEKFSKVFRSSPAAIAITRLRDGLLIEANAALLKLLKYTREEIIGHTTAELSIWADYEDRTRLLERLAQEQSVNDQETRFRASDGEVILTSYSAEVTEIGGEPCLLSLLVDIGQRNQSEEAMRRSEEKFSKVFRSSPAAILITRLSDGVILDANEALLKILKYSREELVGRTTPGLSVWVDPDERRRLVKRIVGGQPVRDEEISFRARDGEVRITRYSGEVLEIGGEPCILSLVVDITEQKMVESALRESEERYRALFENAIEGIFQTTLDGRAIMANSALARILGYGSAREAVERLTDIGSQVYADPEDRMIIIGRLLKDGQVEGSEVLFKRSDGTSIKVILNVRLVRDSDGTPVSIEGSCIDITARWKAEEALKASEEKYRLIFENATEGIFQSTLEGRYLSVNPAFAKMAGYSSPQEMIESVIDIS
ncbi:PAS domain S-box protein, partial [bacterium]|nr:PAS domain S-box protein [bacterium]